MMTVLYGWSPSPSRYERGSMCRSLFWNWGRYLIVKKKIKGIRPYKVELVILLRSRNNQMISPTEISRPQSHSSTFLFYNCVLRQFLLFSPSRHKWTRPLSQVKRKNDRLCNWIFPYVRRILILRFMKINFNYKRVKNKSTQLNTRIDFQKDSFGKI